MTLSLYHLYRRRYAGLDTYSGFVVAAKDVREARKLAAEKAGLTGRFAEGPDWQKTKLTGVVKIGICTRWKKPRIVEASFNAA